MKNLYLTLILALTGVSSMAQDIELYKPGSTADVAGTTIYASWADPSVKKLLTIKNVSGDPKTLTVKRTKVVEVAGAEDYMCWGKSLSPGEGQCYPASQVSPHNPWETPDAYTFDSGEEGILWVYHTPLGNYGQAHYKYEVLRSGVTLATVDVMFNYFLSTPEQKPASFSVYPNPASNVLTVSAENINDKASDITILDISGKTVLYNAVVNGKTQLNIENLNAGIYFYTIRSNKDIIETKKLVIL